MRILFLGDIMGRSGRDGLALHLPRLKAQLKPDAVVVNGENAAGGYGITIKMADELFALGVDVLTTGNHVWGQKELVSAIDRQPRILRPLNYPDGTPGKGFYLHTVPGGRKLLVVNVMARVFMEPVLDDPFVTTEKLLAQYRLGTAAQAILIDFHGEATSEKMAFAHAFDGRASAILGTHTHIPTADERILAGGTATMADVGMCGDYDSAIGMKKELALWRFTRKIPGERMVPAEGIASICGAFITTDDATGKALTIEPVRQGGLLRPILPQ